MSTWFRCARRLDPPVGTLLLEALPLERHNRLALEDRVRCANLLKWPAARVGIVLWTTPRVAGAAREADATPHLPVAQLVSAHEVQARSLLPTVLYARCH